MTAGRCCVLQRDADGNPSYVCDTCSTVFTIPDGGVIECPTCNEILNAPELSGCPHCGGSATIEMEWEKRHHEGAMKFRVICQICGCQTRACNYADDAAASWNDRVEGSS